MPEDYRWSFVDDTRSHSLSIRSAERLRALVRRLSVPTQAQREELQLTRLVSLLILVLLLTFGAVYKLTDGAGHNASWPEMTLAFSALFAFAASYYSEYVRNHINVALRILCYLTATWFIILTSLNAFMPNYAVGLLFILPGLGVGYSVTLHKIRQLAAFFAVTVLAASTACILYSASGITPALFIASLVCISLVTFCVAAGRLDAEKQFHASEERYQAVVQQASDGIFLADAETLTFLDGNPAFCRMMGLPLSELKRMTMSDLLVTPHQDSVEAASPQVNLSHSQISECMLQRDDGSVTYVELHIDKIRYADRYVFSVVVHDVSSRREYEDRLLTAKENAEQIARFKSTLLANMSHEIRTPLSSILGWTTVLDEEVPDEQRELLSLIKQSGHRLQSTLDSVLELAHLDANARRVQPRLVDLFEEVQAAASEMQIRARKKGITLTVEHHCREAFTRLDVTCLRRVLNHLVDNALKFTSEGSVVIGVDRSAKELRIDIRDTGVGISTEFMPSIFEEFKQESDGLNRDHEGNGLGLPIVRRLVRLMNGRITVQSRRGEGSTFSIILPAEPAMSRSAQVA